MPLERVRVLSVAARLRVKGALALLIKDLQDLIQGLVPPRGQELGAARLAVELVRERQEVSQRVEFVLALENHGRIINGVHGIVLSVGGWGEACDGRRLKCIAIRRLDDVLAGLAAAARAGLTPVKVNAVLMRGINDHEAPDLLAYCLEHGYQLRFIEQMPLDAQHSWQRATMVTAEEILDRLGHAYTLTPVDAAQRGSAPAELFWVDGGPATVGVIASVTRPFCGACNRVRLTADGQVRNCLFARKESDLRGPLRAGASDAELAERWRAAVATKLPGHGINDPSFLQPSRPMSAIGG